MPEPGGAPPSVSLTGLEISDSPERWAGAGFHLLQDGRVRVHSVTLTLGIAPPGHGIVAWTLAGLERAGDIDGLLTRRDAARPGPDRRDSTAGNFVTHIDHLVVVSPRFDVLAEALDARGLGLRRVTEIRDRRMGFRRLGGPILEIVESPEVAATAFWGITFAVHGTPGGAESLDALCAANPFLGEPHAAVQPGRRIATLTREAGLSTRVAFIDPSPG